MPILTLIATLNFGYLPIDTFDPNEVKFFQKMEMEVGICETFYISGSIRIQDCLRDLTRLNFTPNRADFEFEAGIKTSGVKIYFRHICIHPIFAYGVSIPALLFEGGREEMGMEISGKAVIF